MKKSKWKNLTSEEKKVIIDKGTEFPHTGIYNNHFDKGTYNCKQCAIPLFKSEDKFNSNCGWPSFDEEINNAIKKVIDKDGKRIEIICANCNGHLGHLFTNEFLSKKNKRYCVNSISIDFKKKS